VPIRAAETGVDGTIVSYHGGRQLDQAPALLEVLPAIHAAVGEKGILVLDGGIRRGADIIIALCMGGVSFSSGARPCMVPWREAFAARAGRFEILRDEIDRIMVQIGCPNLEEFGPGFLLN
jgi:(S)-mandelate dehydrogenase